MEHDKDAEIDQEDMRRCVRHVLRQNTEERAVHTRDLKRILNTKKTGADEVAEGVNRELGRLFLELVPIPEKTRKHEYWLAKKHAGNTEVSDEELFDVLILLVISLDGKAAVSDIVECTEQHCEHGSEYVEQRVRELERKKYVSRDTVLGETYYRLGWRAQIEYDWEAIEKALSAEKRINAAT